MPLLPPPNGGRTSDFIESREYEKPLSVYGILNSCLMNIIAPNLPEAGGWTRRESWRGHQRGSMAWRHFHLNTQLSNGESPKLFESSENFKARLRLRGRCGRR